LSSKINKLSKKILFYCWLQEVIFLEKYKNIFLKFLWKLIFFADRHRPGPVLEDYLLSRAGLFKALRINHVRGLAGLGVYFTG